MLFNDGLETDFKIYLANKLSKILGYDVDIESIDNINIGEYDDNTDLTIDDITTLYTFSIMDENYEKANKLYNELTNKNCLVRMVNNTDSKKGEIQVINNDKFLTTVHMNVLPYGMVIDWEKQNF